MRVYVDMLYEGYLRAEMNEKAMAEDIANYIQNGLSDKNDRSAED